jgi:tetratricopeptide (TPR) repeat protein
MGESKLDSLETAQRDKRRNPPTEKAEVILEEGKPLSQSILWRLQRNFFEEQGIEAWRQGTVPYYVTTNPFIANAYSKAVFGYIRDCRAVTSDSPNGSFPPLDPDQPLYVIELGSGSGRFAYHFLKRFRAIYLRSVLSGIPFKYIMTDFTERNVEFWRDHQSLKPLVEEGVLDFALFDGERDEMMKLTESGDLLAHGTVKNPMVVIANYFFDSIPQDAFFIQGGQFHEGLVTVTSCQQEADLNDPELLSRVEISYDRNPADSDYYENPDWNEILEYYQSRLDGTALLFPCAALQCIQNLSILSNGRLLLVSGDKGYSREEDLLGRGEPGISRHGSFSMMVNYHAIGKYVKKKGGQPLHTAHRHAHLNISAFLLGSHPGGYTETLQAYREAVETCGPDDFYALKKAIEHGYESWTLEQLLAYIRLSGFDAKITLGCYPALIDHIEHASDSEKQELYRIIKKVWEVYYPLAEDQDVASHLGVLLYELSCYTEALELFVHSIELHGLDATVSYNLGLCHYGLGEMDSALECFNEALVFDPDFEEAKTLLIKIKEVTPPMIQPHTAGTMLTDGH